MSFLTEHFDALVALATPAVVAGLKHHFRGKVKARYALKHEFHFLVQEPMRDAQGNVLKPSQTVHTRTMAVKNFGTKTAKGLSITFNYKPMYLNFWPPRATKQDVDENGRNVIAVGDLAANEELVIAMLAVNADVPAVLQVRHDGGLAIEQSLMSVPIFPLWMRAGFILCTVLGASTLLYGAIHLCSWLLRQMTT